MGCVARRGKSSRGPTTGRRLIAATMALLAAAWTTCFMPRPAQAQAPPRGPQLDIQTMLVKNALTAANHANITGNYTVLRDLGTSAFRQRNSAAQLAATFENL